MARAISKKRSAADGSKTDPLCKIKLAEAMRTLLIDKDFSSITIAELSRASGSNEALIYRYFGDKRGLQNYVLEKYMIDHLAKFKAELKHVDGVLEKLKKIVWVTFDFYNSNRVFAKIILIEARNYPGYFESKAFKLIKEYATLIDGLLEEAVENGIIRDDVPVKDIRNAITGAISHLALPGILFGRQFSPNVLTERLFSIMVNGILKEK
jgi:TetR/AcrR family fatty acid metabolism transcriptional regulator